MRFDECKHTFGDLATLVLPDHMRRLRDAMQSPIQASHFAEANRGPKAIAKQLQLTGDFAGCYIFLESGRAMYAGISRSVLARIRQHLCGKTHFDASLAYRIAKRNKAISLDPKQALFRFWRAEVYHFRAKPDKKESDIAIGRGLDPERNWEWEYLERLPPLGGDDFEYAGDDEDDE